MRATTDAEVGIENTLGGRCAYSHYWFSLAYLLVRLYSEMFQRRFF